MNIYGPDALSESAQKMTYANTRDNIYLLKAGSTLRGPLIVDFCAASRREATVAKTELAEITLAISSAYSAAAKLPVRPTPTDSRIYLSYKYISKTIYLQ